jgi:hypothetical protein
MHFANYIVLGLLIAFMLGALFLHEESRANVLDSPARREAAGRHCFG